LNKILYKSSQALQGELGAGEEEKDGKNHLFLFHLTHSSSVIKKALIAIQCFFYL